MKKIITIVMCVLLVSLTLVSCGGKKEAATTQAATTAPATTTTTAPATTTTVKAEAPKAEAPKAETPAPVAETPAPAAQAAEDKVVFRISNGAEPESLDPAKIQGVPEHRLY